MFNPQTMGKLKGLSQQAKEKQGAKNYGGETRRLAGEIARAERGYEDELEQLAVEIIKDTYPIVDKYNIKIDAKIEPMSQNTAIPRGEFQDKPGEQGYSPEEKEDMDAKRRLINALTQGAGVRGSRSFVVMKDYLDSIDKSLVDKYGKILDVALGGYDDENFIAQILAGIANDNNMPGGSSLPVYDKANKQWIVKARAINFPILIHEIVKGIYSVIGSRGWSKNKALNQASVASVDKLRNEPDDLRYGKFMLDAISDAINKFYNKSNVSDPYVRDVFMAKLVELPYPQLRDFIQNAINDELNAGQEKWAKDTISKISSLKEYKINTPNQYDGYTEELIEFFKKDTLFKGFDKILINNYSKILDNTWKLYNDVYKEFDIDHTDKNIPQNKNELLTQYVDYTFDPFYLEVNRFLFPYITIHLKKKGWNWDDGEFSKNDQGFDIFDYIEPFWFDTDVRDRSFEDLEEYIRDNWSNIPLKEYKVNKPGPHYIIVHNDGTDEIYNLHHFIAPTYQKFKEEFEDMFNQYTFKREIDSKLYLICKDKDEYNNIVNMIERDDSDLEELEDDFKPADETIWKIWPKPKHL
jgi:hypothetical protein